MKYLICQNWSNTSNNHAGIKHLCMHIEKIDSTYKTIIIPYGLNRRIRGQRKINFVWRYIATLKHCKRIIEQINNEDIVVFMEYMDHPAILLFAQKLHKKNPNIRILGMAHLVPALYDKRLNENSFKTWEKSVDLIITLGHSLTDYFIKRGCPTDKLITTFHYVDDEYYHYPEKSLNAEKKLQAIVMGNMMRDIDIVQKLIKKNPEINFVICQGRDNFENLFSQCENVKLIPFVEEDELRQLMQTSDISLNVMKDTIGSNVIVTSMAMGLAMICSDVGSIRDYCTESCCMFCSNDNIDSFSSALSTLHKDREKLLTMQNKAIEQSKKFYVRNFYQMFNAIVSKREYVK